MVIIDYIRWYQTVVCPSDYVSDEGEATQEAIEQGLE